MYDSEALGLARAMVTSVLMDEPEVAVEQLSKAEPQTRFMVTLALAAMLATAMESISQLDGNGDVLAAWQGAIMDLLSDPAE